jgi:O-antigen/teichoic acid export membrane protein
MFKHSLLYGVSQIISRSASLLLLPVYTRYLDPGDYGLISLLDISGAFLGMLLGAGMTAAVMRYHFDTDDQEERRRLWYTAIVFATLIVGLGLGIILSLSGQIADLLLPQATIAGPQLVTVALLAAAMGILGELLGGYWYVKKWSQRVAILSIFHLSINISLNLYFLIGLDMGVMGILLGNVAAAAVSISCTAVLNVRDLGRFSINFRVLPKLWRFGFPIVLVNFVMFILMRSDQYYLRAHWDIADVGIYALADNIAMAAYIFLVNPFLKIWQVTKHEIAAQKNAENEYSRVFEGFTLLFAVVFIGGAIGANIIFHVLATEAFYDAANLLPPLLLAYFFFALRIHFSVPSVLAKKSHLEILPSICAAALAIGGNALISPSFGAEGAAWVKVVCMVWLSFHMLFINRRLNKIPYDFGFLIVLLIASITLVTSLYIVLSANAVSLAFEILVVGIVWLMVVGIALAKVHNRHPGLLRNVWNNRIGPKLPWSRGTA